MSDRTVAAMTASVASITFLLAGCATTSGAAVMVATNSPGANSTPVTRTVVSTVVSTVVRTETVTETADATDVVDFPDRVFDEDKVSAGVTSILTGAPPAGYGLTGISDVRCPPNQPVTAGTGFTCTLLVDGENTTVSIVVINDDGLYEVNPPS